MNNLLGLAAHNTVAALLLALLVSGLSRVWRNPPVIHVLWLLVLLKLVAPPVVRVDCSMLWPPGPTAASSEITGQVWQTGGQAPEIPTRLVDRLAARPAAEPSPASKIVHEPPAIVQPLWARARAVLFGLWLGGTGLCMLVAAARVVRFERLLRDTLPAPERLQRLAAEIAAKLAIRRVPLLRLVECVKVPFLWCAGLRPTIVLPLESIDRLDDQSAALILAHELAHLRRRDHWVRGLELFASTIYWWNPLLWLIRRQIHQSEEVCCDAWVRWTFPDATRRYAEVVFQTAESLNAAPLGSSLLPASPFLRSLSLKARIEMILESRFAPRLSTRSLCAIAVFAFFVLPCFVETTSGKARAGSSDPATTSTGRNADPAAAAEFPYAVRFEQGATRFLDGDKITIEQVRGTADTFTPGNIYWIKGTYTLASHHRAMLAAYITAADSADGKGAYLKVQTTGATEGNGSFTLFLPMPYRGWPHVSFYPADGGSDFGGNYFGTGDSVLKEWWGSLRAARNAAKAPAGSRTDASAPRPPNLEVQVPAEFLHVVQFEQGATRFLNGDKITILEVKGSADKFAPNQFYQIKGTYTLASHNRATLAAYVTAADAADGNGSSFKVQTTVVDRGDGTFTLILPMSCRGWPHVSFYPTDGGSDFGGSYFGTGDSVLKKWWGN
jgi:beta-lactamase regulating signal transducer with metallopeptidase domain